MQEENIKQYTGKRCLIILKNSYQYTTVIPIITNNSIKFIDKFGEPIEVACSFIEYIKIIEDEQ